jgi:hypothetical protein
MVQVLTGSPVPNPYTVHVNRGSSHEEIAIVHGATGIGMLPPYQLPVYHMLSNGLANTNWMHEGICAADIHPRMVFSDTVLRFNTVQTL